MTEPAHARESLEAALQRMTRGAVPWVSDEEVARYEAAKRREERMARVVASGVEDVLPPDMLDAVVDDRLDDTEALDLTRRWARYQRTRPRPGPDLPVLALVGAMGRGKTVAAAWLIAELSGRYVEAEELCRLQAHRYGDERQAYRRILRSTVLVVDELGTEEHRDRAAAALHDVVNRRQRRLTLLLGNVGGAELRERLDPRTWDRLRAGGRIVELAGESLRRSVP